MTSSIQNNNKITYNPIQSDIIVKSTTTSNTKPIEDAPVYEEILEARENIKGYTHITDIFTSETLNNELTQTAYTLHSNKVDTTKQVQVFFKCENFQKTGSFKFRGAFNAIRKLSDEAKSKGVLAYSAGNHGQGIALACRIFGIKARIIIPLDTSKLKIDAMSGYGAEFYFFDRYKDDIDEVIKYQKAITGMTFVSPFDQRDVIAGQGTIACEIVEQIGNVDHMVIGIGGGGLISGCSIAAHHLLPNCRIHGVQPDGFYNVSRSIEAGEVIPNVITKTIADGASTPRIGQRNLPIIQKHLDHILNVSDEELIASMMFIGERCKMIVEPTGCLGLAAIRRLVAQGVITPGEKVVSIISGGNISLQRYAMLITSINENSINISNTYINTPGR